MKQRHVPRFYCPGLETTMGLDKTTAPLESILSPEQNHHLLAVLRRQVNDELLLFNERVGEYRAHVAHVEKKTASLQIMSLEKSPMPHQAKTVLYFALLEKSRLDTLIPKAVELGASDLIPVITDLTERKKEEWQKQKEKWQKVALGATELSGRLAPATLHDAIELEAMASPAMPIIYGDEKGGANFRETLALIKNNATSNHDAVGLLVGPPGGFTDSERKWLRAQQTMQATKQKKFFGVSLGDTILRSETAGLAMLAGLFFYNRL